jgi:stringent starvation protein B
VQVVAALKTHLLNAVYGWAVENGFTPHIVIDTRAPGVRVPNGFADENGRLVLNVHPRALQHFTLDDAWLRFSARFAGTPHPVEAPLGAVLAIYAKENGQGISFPVSNETDSSSPEPDDDGSPPKRPSLRVVK